MLVRVSPYNRDGLRIEVDRATARRIVRALSQQDDVEDQDAAFIIDQAIKRWVPPQGE